VFSPRLRAGSPVTPLLLGLIVTLATVVAYSWYITGQIGGLRLLQSELADRNRRESLQLLRIQNDLHQLGLAMRDMLDNDEPYPLTAWAAQFERIRLDLTEALTRQGQVALAPRTPDQMRFLTTSVAQFWDAVDRMFETARAGQDDEARVQIRLSLQARQAALSTGVSRLLVQNNEAEEQTAQRVEAIYRQVERQVYWFLSATLAAIALTSLYAIRANRRLFARLASLSDQRRELAQALIATRESTLREISRELHDEFGQLLTAMGSMLGRAGRHAPETSGLRAELREIGEIAQTALDQVRGLSQTLHPSILEELGLESTVDWYLSTAAKQLGVRVSYERSGEAAPIDGTIAIHVYRVLQEAISNVARHSGSTEALVRLRLSAATLELEVEDHGVGVGVGIDGAARTASHPTSTDANPGHRGLGLVAMRERAALLSGTIAFLSPPGGGTLIRLVVPLRRDGDGVGSHSGLRQ
jgi:signal transduction histidine kinase